MGRAPWRPAAPIPPLRVELAAVRLEVGSPDPAFAACAAERLGRFASPAEPTFRVEHLPAGDAPGGLASRMAVRAEAVQVLERPGGFALRAATFGADVDLDRRWAVLRSPGAAYPLDALLRHLLPALVPDGLVLHGAGLVADGRGVACCGPSGAGKTTLAGLLPAWAVCDELVALRRAQGRPRLFALPFWKARPAEADLVAVHVLRHGPQHARRRLGLAEALRALVRHTLWPVHAPDASHSALEVAASLAEAVPVWDLAFAPRADVAPFVLEATA